MRSSKFKIVYDAEIYPYILKKNKKKIRKKIIDDVIIKNNKNRFCKTKMSPKERKNKKFKKNIKKYGLNTQINIGIGDSIYLCTIKQIDYETNLIMLQYPGGYTAEYTMKSIKRMNVMAIYLTQKRIEREKRRIDLRTRWCCVYGFTPTQMN